MRVVVHREALRAARRVVRVRLHRVAERGLERAAEAGERRPVVVSAWRTIVAPSSNAAATRSASAVPRERLRAARRGRPCTRRADLAPSLTSRNAGKRSAPEQISRSTSAARGGRRSDLPRPAGRRAAAAPSSSARKSAGSNGSTQRARALRTCRCRRCRRRSRRCRRRPTVRLVVLVGVRDRQNRLAVPRPCAGQDLFVRRSVVRFSSTAKAPFRSCWSRPDLRYRSAGRRGTSHVARPVTTSAAEQQAEVLADVAPVGPGQDDLAGGAHAPVDRVERATSLIQSASG